MKNQTQKFIQRRNLHPTGIAASILPLLAGLAVAALVTPLVSQAQETGAPARADVEITGLMASFGKKEVFLRVTETRTAGQPAAAARSVILREGGKDGAIEVVQIDVKNGTVRIKNAGQEQTLSTAGISSTPIQPSAASAPTTPATQTAQPESPSARTATAVPQTWEDAASASQVVVIGRRSTSSTPPATLGIVPATNGQ